MRTELVEWPVLVYAQLPTAYTDPVQPPPPPPLACALPDGRKVPCVLDALMREQQWQALLLQVNEDRASAGRLSGQAASGLRDLTRGDGQQ